MLKSIFRYFSNSKYLSILNCALILISVVFNSSLQVFCNPTTWAMILLIICFSNTILFPILTNRKLILISSFINGISLFVFLYCVVFLEHMNFFGLILILIGLGLVTFIPHFFVLQLLQMNLIKPKIESTRIWFLTAFFICIGITIYIGNEYKFAIQSIEKFKASNYTKLEKTFMNEKILGMHFIYHTRFCEYDGWRPPKHEPILILGMWLNNRKDPLDVCLATRLDLYIKNFPLNQYKFDCSCAIEYSQNYHNDNLWPY